MRQLAFRTAMFPTALEGDLDLNNGSPGSAAANWLRAALIDEGVSCGAPFQEDYGWGFWLENPCMVWVAVGCAEGEGEGDAPSEWVVSVSHERPIFAPAQWFKGAQGKALTERAIAILSRALAAAPEVDIAG